MIAAVTLVLCVALVAYGVRRHRSRNRRALEETARFRSLQRWLTVLDEDRDPGESFVEYQERKQLRPSGAERR